MKWTRDKPTVPGWYWWPTWLRSGKVSWVTRRAMDNLIPNQRDRALLGFCPFCERPIRGWHLPVEGFPPELYRLIRDEWKIDPRTGHAESCPEKGVTLGGG